MTLKVGKVQRTWEGNGGSSMFGVNTLVLVSFGESIQILKYCKS